MCFVGIFPGGQDNARKKDAPRVSNVVCKRCFIVGATWVTAGVTMETSHFHHARTSLYCVQYVFLPVAMNSNGFLVSL